MTSIKKIGLGIFFCTGIAMAGKASADTARHLFSGSLLNSGNRQPLEAATITIWPGPKKYHSSREGKFQISAASPGQYRIRIESIGYQTYTGMVWIPGQADIELVEQETELEKIVVTAVAGKTRIKGTPISIAVVGQKEMARNNGTNLIDLLTKAVPGISAITTGPNISKPFIRGLGYNRVLTMYDGLRQEGQQWGDEHGIEIDPYGIARAEIVKGPASLLYGSDAMAGVINLIPALPTVNDGKMHGDALSEYQSNNRMAASSLSLLYKKNNFSWMARASAKSATNYRNAIDKYVYNTGFTEWNLSTMAAWEKGHNRHSIHFTVYDDLQEIPDGSRDSLSRLFTYQNKETLLDDIRNRPLVPIQRLNSRTISELHQHIQHYRLYHKANILIGKNELNTLIGFQQNIRREYNHPSQPRQAGLFVKLNTINYEAAYRFPEWQGIQFSSGINGMYQQNRNKDATDFPIPDYTLFDFGAYFLAKKEFSKTVITAGMRYDSRNVNWTDFYTRKDPSSGFSKQAIAPDTTNSQLAFPAYSRLFTGFSGSIGAVFRFSNSLTLKANTASGYRSPSIPEIGSDGLDPGAHIYYIGNRNAKPEFNWQSDIGFFLNETGFDLNFELFYNRISNYIFFQKLFDANGQPLELVPGNFTYQYKQGSAAILGTEASLLLHPASMPWLNIQQQFSITHGINTDHASLKLLGDAARYLPLIPPVKTNTSIRIRLPEQKKWIKEPFLQMDMETAATQNRFYAVDNTETLTSGYTLFHINAGLQIVSAKEKPICRLVINASNIFDIAYQSHQNRLKYFEYYTASPNGSSGIYNMGRNISIKLMVNW